MNASCMAANTCSYFPPPCHDDGAQGGSGFVLLPLTGEGGEVVMDVLFAGQTAAGGDGASQDVPRPTSNLPSQLRQALVAARDCQVCGV